MRWSNASWRKTNEKFTAAMAIAAAAHVRTVGSVERNDGLADAERSGEHRIVEENPLATTSLPIWHARGSGTCGSD
jgi:hypothetical protein